MNEISRIQAALRPHLSWYGASLTFLSLFLVALFRVETVNLDKLASVFANRAQSAGDVLDLWLEPLACFAGKRFRKNIRRFRTLPKVPQTTSV